MERIVNARQRGIEKIEANNNHKYHFISISSFMKVNDCAHTVRSYAIDEKSHRVHTQHRKIVCIIIRWQLMIFIDHKIYCILQLQWDLSFIFHFYLQFVEWRIAIINPSSLVVGHWPFAIQQFSYQIVDTWRFNKLNIYFHTIYCVLCHYRFLLGPNKTHYILNIYPPIVMQTIQRA